MRSGLWGAGSAFTLFTGAQWQFHYNDTGGGKPPTSATSGLPATALDLSRQQLNAYAFLPHRDNTGFPDPTVTFLFSGTSTTFGRFVRDFREAPIAFHYSGVPMTEADVSSMDGIVDEVPAQMVLGAGYTTGGGSQSIGFERLQSRWHNATAVFPVIFSARVEQSYHTSPIMRSSE
jgi:hypothetical protein